MSETVFEMEGSVSLAELKAHFDRVRGLPDGWEPIDSAPRGSVVKKTHHKTGKEYDSFVHVRVLTWRAGGERMMSRFLPEGTEGARDGDRWEGYTRNHPPTHWLRGSETQPQEPSNG